MKHYRIRVYLATAWSILTQSDHFQDHYIDSSESLEAIAKRLAHDGFRVGQQDKWIMPGAILTIELIP